MQISKTDIAIGTAGLLAGAAVAFAFSRTKLSPAFMAVGLAPPAIAAAVLAVKGGRIPHTIPDDQLKAMEGESGRDHLLRLLELFSVYPGFSNCSLAQEFRKGKDMEGWDLSRLAEVGSVGFFMECVGIKKELRPEIDAAMQRGLRLDQACIEAGKRSTEAIAQGMTLFPGFKVSGRLDLHHFEREYATWEYSDVRMRLFELSRPEECKRFESLGDLDDVANEHDVSMLSDAALIKFLDDLVKLGK